MFDADGQHQSAATAILGDLTRGIGVSLHKRYQTGRRQCRILNGGTFRTYMAEIMTDPSTTLHQLNLLFVDTDYAAVRIRSTVKTDYKTVGERADLIAVADSGHRAPLRHNILEILQIPEHFVVAHRIGIFAFDSGNLRCDAVMHIVGSKFIDIAERVLQGIFAHPHTGGQLVAAEILQRCVVSFIVRIVF